MNSISDKITEFLKPLLVDGDLFLVDIELKGQHSNQVVWVYLDAENRGINVEDCAKISYELSLVIDANELFSGKYTLNVSSPGLDRPLTDKRQYKKNVGRKVRILISTDDRLKEVTGQLLSFDEEELKIKPENNEAVTISYNTIKTAKVLPAW